MVNFDVVIKWMEYIRNNPENAYRFSENFWQSQIKSKEWLLKYVTDDDKNIVIFGGWYGIFAQFISEKYPDAYIVTTDNDPDCRVVFDQININRNIKFRVHDMQDGMCLASLEPDLVINTSTEHVTQKVYDDWWNSVRTGTKYIVQGNNLDIPEHIRPANDLAHFLKINRIKNPAYAGMMKCGDFYRYMAVGIK